MRPFLISGIMVTLMASANLFAHWFSLYTSKEIIYLVVILYFVVVDHVDRTWRNL
jgi:hypothetical protein